MSKRCISKFVLHLRLADPELDALFLEVHLLFELRTLGLLLSHKLLVVIFVLLEAELLFFFGGEVDFFFALDVLVGLPCGVDDLAAHEVLLFHFFKQPIHFFSVEQLVDHSLVVRHVPVDEIETSRDYLQLVHDLLQLE